MQLTRRLTLKAGDQILTQERGRGLTPQPELTKKIKADPTLFWDMKDDFVEETLKLGSVFYVWKSSRNAYMPIYFQDFGGLTATIDV